MNGLGGVDCTGVGEVTPSGTLGGVGEDRPSGVAPSEAGGKRKPSGGAEAEEDGETGDGGVNDLGVVGRADDGRSCGKSARGGNAAGAGETGVVDAITGT